MTDVHVVSVLPDALHARLVDTLPSDRGVALSRADETADVAELLREDHAGDGVALVVGDGGVGLVETVGRAAPTVPVLLFGKSADDSAVVAAIEAGALDYVDATTEGANRRLAARVRRVLDGRTPGNDGSTSDDGAVGAGDDSERAAQLEAIAAAASDVVVGVDRAGVVQFVNPAVEDVLGYRPADLVGEPLTRLMSDEVARRHEAGMARYLETGERRVDWEYVELPGRHSDGHEVPLGVSFAEYGHRGERYFAGVVRDVTAQRRRTDRLAALNRAMESMTGAETAAEVCELLRAAATDPLGCRTALVALYDAEIGHLRPVGGSREESTLEDVLSDGGADHAWTAFSTGETRRFESALDGSRRRVAGGESGDEPDTLSVLPLGRHGVLVLGAHTTAAVGDEETHLTDILRAAAVSSLDRAERERSLREQRDALRSRNERLERLERINRVVRAVVRGLTEATSREEVERTVCTRLVGADLYRFAWFGRVDEVTQRVEPVAAAGVGQDYLDALTVSVDPDDEHGQGPTGVAARTRRVQVQDDIRADPPFEPWREPALRRGYRSSAAVPVVYHDRLYGVLNLYASESEAFDRTERQVLAELGETIGYAVGALERKQAFVGRQSVELEYEIEGRDGPLRTLVDSGEFEFEALVQRTDGRLHLYFTARDVDVSTVEAAAGDSPEVTALRHITTVDDGREQLFECTLGYGSFFESLLDRGVVVRDLVSTPGHARLTLRAPVDADVRGLSRSVAGAYDGAELVARRERDDPVMTRTEFESAFTERLTERQAEVLRTAYFSGFFEWPRRTTGQELADALGVSQPTVNRHIRAGERKLFGLLFGDEGGGE
ncbi:bacterio-opsin activator domain-containing protein [Halobium salinum]|uniref:Bacterio-opsin activator domain-containing protein n=1 Tax=Halobium salinum TaxID=1364940 RepID=A0ABD5P7Z5_9EURY|nr:bacterio-opsin activator domain-containing protein [Halobium salinum]